MPWGSESRPRARRRVEAEKRLLDDVLGLTHAPDHPVRDGEQQRPKLPVQVFLLHPARKDDAAGLPVTAPPRSAAMSQLRPLRRLQGKHQGREDNASILVSAVSESGFPDQRGIR